PRRAAAGPPGRRGGASRAGATRRLQGPGTRRRSLRREGYARPALATRRDRNRGTPRRTFRRAPPPFPVRRSQGPMRAEAAPRNPPRRRRATAMRLRRSWRPPRLWRAPRDRRSAGEAWLPSPRLPSAGAVSLLLHRASELLLQGGAQGVQFLAVPHPRGSVQCPGAAIERAAGRASELGVPLIEPFEGRQFRARRLSAPRRGRLGPVGRGIHRWRRRQRLLPCAAFVEKDGVIERRAAIERPGPAAVAVAEGQRPRASAEGKGCSFHVGLARRLDGQQPPFTRVGPL